MNIGPDTPFFVSIPHSGEQVPPEVTWLQNLPEVTLMRDVDRFVDRLYQPTLDELKIPSIVTAWHRYVVDLNRKPDEYDATAVMGAEHPVGTHPKGLHWSVTTHKEVLIPEPMPMNLHQELVAQYYRPFHESVQQLRKTYKEKWGQVYHLDLHSMPSLGTDLHPDPGELRADVVISDQHGQSSMSEFKNLAIEAYQKAGFQVAYNWPYVGGGITKTYGEPQKSFHTVQVELNRRLYMNEETKQLNMETLSSLQSQLRQALGFVLDGVKELNNG